MTSSHHRSSPPCHPGAVWRPLILAAALLVSAFATPTRACDVVSYWTARANDMAIAKGQSPVSRAHGLAILHVAMFEAMNVVERRDTPNKLALSADGDVSVDAAAASAAHGVLVALYPDQAIDLSVALTAALAAIPNDVPKVRGYLLGKDAAAKTLALWSSPTAAGKQDMARQVGGAAVGSP